MSLRNFRDVLGGDLAGKAFTGLFLLGLLRWLKPADFALLMTLQSVIILAVTLPSGILNRHYLLTPEAEQDARSYRALQIGVAGLTSLPVLTIISPQAPWHAVLTALVCCLAGAWFEFGRTNAQRSGRFDRWARAEALRALLLLPALLWVLLPGQTVVSLILGTQALGYAIASRLTGHVGGAPTRVRGALAAVCNARSLHLVLYFALVALFGQLPMLLVAAQAPADEMAGFAAAYRYYGLLMSVLSSANVVILTKVAAGQGNPNLDLTSLQRWAAGLLFGGMLIGFQLIPLVDGGKYPTSPYLFVGLALALLPGLASAPLAAEMLKAGRGLQLLGSQLAALLGFCMVFAAPFPQSSYAATAGVPVACLCQFLILTWLRQRRGQEGMQS